MEHIALLSVPNHRPIKQRIDAFDNERSKFDDIFKFSHLTVTGSWHNGRESINFEQLTSGNLKEYILSNHHISGSYSDGAAAIFGFKDPKNNLWVGLEFSEKTLYFNTSFNRKLKYEDCATTIDNVINKRRHKWHLTAVQWLDYDDVSQILRLHIYKKFHMWDQSKPLEPWINIIIGHQISNLLRNIYGNYSRPCLRCSANEGGNFCSLYSLQCEKCPLYAKWIKTKKQAYDSKLPLPLEHHLQEVFDKPEEFFDIQRSAETVHAKMKEILKPTEYEVYQYLFIDGKKESELGELLGYKTSERNRDAGYRMIKNIKDSIIKKAKHLLYSGNLDL